MRNLMLSIILCSCIHANAQDTTFMKVNTGTTDKQLADILKFEGIEEYDVEISNHKLKGKPVLISYEEYMDGEMVKEKTLSELPEGWPASSLNAASDTVRFKLLSQEKDNVAKVNFKYSGFSFQELFETPHHTGAYSMREIFGDEEKNAKHVGNKEKKALFVYTLPFEGDHNKYYCTATSTDVPVTQWWDKYHVKHYIIFYVQVG